jgi:uncharacterized membrane protein YfcA
LSILILSALLIGINKTAVPGIGALPVVLLAIWFEPRLSAGLQLVMLAMTDVMAVAYYRRHADWKIVLRLCPWALCGLAVGHFSLDLISDDLMRPVLGGIIIALCLLRQFYKRISPDKIPSGNVIAGVCGVLLGFTTMVANAAGPVAAIYFLTMKLPKDKYMGCSGLVRMDYIVRDGEIFFLETNTVPGMTPMSLVPAQVRAAGISMEEFVNTLIENIR